MTQAEIEALKAELAAAKEALARVSHIWAFQRFACECGYTWLEKAPVTASLVKPCISCASQP